MPGNPGTVTQTATPRYAAEMLVIALGVHGEQDAPPGGDVVPEAQGAHAVVGPAPAAVPAGQAVHVEDPGEPLYDPWNGG